MKSKLLISGIVLAVAILLAGCGQPLSQEIDLANQTPIVNSDPIMPISENVINQGETSDQINFVLDTVLPETTGKLKTYKFIKPNVTVDSVVSLGNKLGFTGQAAPTDPGIIAMSNPEKLEMLQVHTKSGAIGYTLTSTSGLFSTSPKLPSNEEAIANASDYLKKAGLWFPDVQVREAVVGATFNGVPSHILVRFNRYIDGIPTTGPGDKFGVRIGDQGKVINSLIFHPEFEAASEVRCIDPFTAYNNLISGKNNPNVPKDCKEVRITEVSLGYYLESMLEMPETLVPAYVFKGQCLDKNGINMQDFISWVKATVQ